MAIRNGARYLRPAIDSILGQTERDLELVVVDDGSDDQTLAMLAGFNDHRLTVVPRGKEGLTRSLNAGLALVRAPYLARMDADDVAYPLRLERQALFLDGHPRVLLCGTWADVVNDNGRFLERGTPPVHDGAIRAQLLWDNAFFHSTWMARTVALHDAGGYDERVERAQDYDLAWRLSQRGSLANIPEPLLRWRRSRHGVSVRQREAQRRSVGVISLRALSRQLGHLPDEAWFWRLRKLWDGDRDSVEGGDALRLRAILPVLPQESAHTVLMELVVMVAAAAAPRERTTLMRQAWITFPAARRRFATPKIVLRLLGGRLGLRAGGLLRKAIHGY